MENLEQAQVTTTDGVGGEAPTPQPQPELTITDLQNLRAIIDTAARRGAFPAAEMQAVGSVFDRLNKFLEVVTPQTPDQSQTPTA
jgi:hypothetical protein